MVGINNELDLCFSKCSVDIIAGYYYDSCDDVILQQLQRFRSIVTEIGITTESSQLSFDIDTCSYERSTFQNKNCFLAAVEHRLLVQSYQMARIGVPLFIQQSGFFRGGVFPKMGIGPEAEMVYRMVTNSDLNVLTHFRKIRGDGAEHIIDYKCVQPIQWDNSDYVRLLDTYASGDIEFLKYVANFHGYNFEEKIRISITDNVVVVGDMYNVVLYSDSSVKPINVFEYTYNPFVDWEDYDNCEIGDCDSYGDGDDDNGYYDNCETEYYDEYEENHRDDDEPDRVDWGDRDRYWDGDYGGDDDYDSDYDYGGDDDGDDGDDDDSGF